MMVAKGAPRAGFCATARLERVLRRAVAAKSFEYMLIMNMYKRAKYETERNREE